jgi:hypothetical protein
MTAGGERYVLSAGIRAAIKGREADLLKALEIPWRSGSPHIRCPDPRHSDANPLFQDFWAAIHCNSIEGN